MNGLSIFCEKGRVRKCIRAEGMKLTSNKTNQIQYNITYAKKINIRLIIFCDNFLEKKQEYFFLKKSKSSKCD